MPSIISQELKDLIFHLRESKTIPVRKSAICSWIKEKGLQDNVEIFEAPLPPGLVRGAILQFETKQAGADIYRVARILVSDALDYIWMEFVICKEMMHIFDRENERTFENDQVIHVIENLNKFGFDLNSIEKRSTDEIHDKFAVFLACLCLVPINGLRTELQNKIHSNNLTIGQAASILRIPLRHAELCLTSHFDEAAEVVLK